MPHARSRTGRQQHRPHRHAGVQVTAAIENASHAQPPQQENLPDAATTWDATVRAMAVGSARLHLIFRNDQNQFQSRAILPLNFPKRVTVDLLLTLDRNLSNERSSAP
jgi:hypothetical protein